MTRRQAKLPKSRSNMIIRKAAEKSAKLPMADRIQLMVKAKLISQEEADKAKADLSGTSH